MKKMRLSVLLAAFALSSTLFAQVSVQQFPNLQEQTMTAEDYQNFRTSVDLKLNKKATVSSWYSYQDILGDNGERFTYFTGTHMWPDSLPVILLTAGVDHIGLHGIGEVFDPKSFYFIEPTPQFNQHNNYTVDSIAFFYKYLNRTGIADTLLVQFYNMDKLASLSFGGTTPTYSVVLNKATSTGSSSTISVKIPLDASNNTDNFYVSSTASFSGVMQIPVNVNVPKGGLCAFTATFMPGNYPVALGDTLASDSTQIPVKPLNSFVPLVFRGDGAASALDNSFNLGLFNFSTQKYSTRSPEWFYPANAPGALKQYIYSQFHITSGNLSANGVKNGFGLGNAYPNPAAKNDEISIDFALGRTEKVTIELFDLLGQKVKTIAVDNFTQGSHTVSFTANDLNSGVYIYNIKAGAYSASKKLTLTK
jgi:hypothetical protein